MGDILIVDDEKDIRELIAEILEDEGYKTRRAGTSDEALAELVASEPALVILDIWLKDSQMDGIDILKKIKIDTPHVPCVIISGHGNIEIAVAAIKQGAYDFIEKPFNIDQLLVIIRRAMEAAKLRRENSELRTREAPTPEMIGTGPAFRMLKSQLEKVVNSNGRVLLQGPSGCGKELAARYIHQRSDRGDAPFVTISCAGMDPNRMEEMLFGRESAAHGVEPGLLEQANTGVVYFDEVGDMPLGTQSKILRVLVSQKFQRLGGSETVKVDMRVISSTAKDLGEEIAAGRFRDELFHRLSVVPIDVPGLDERREDIPELSAHFVGELNAQQGLPLRTISADAMAALQSMSWPGNIRQLRNVIERVLILGPADKPIQPQEFASAEPGPDEAGGKLVLSSQLATLPLREARELFEREYLLTQINRFGGNISRTAAFVGMERSALHRKLKSLGVVTSAKSGARVAMVDAPAN